jgi:tetratricopeptide (TPR) repeat protein
MRPARFISVLLAAALLVALAPGGAYADDEAAAPPAQKKAWVKKWGRLGPVYDYAKRLTAQGEHLLALKLLAALKRSNNPRVLNFMGYNARKLGRPEEAIEHYRKALAIAPGFTLARAYMGGAWLQLGQVDEARKQLAEIERLCGGQACAEYRDLARMIAAQGMSKPGEAILW